MRLKWTGVVAVVALAANLFAGDPLPPPERQGGLPLMECLNLRKSSREFGSEALPPQVLSNLLWAASGVNRDDGRRTSPTARNRQEVEIFVATADGVFRYDAAAHALVKHADGDSRDLTGTQDFVKDAAVNLVYVADWDKMGDAGEEDKLLYSGADVGCIVQNVYLYCASAGLATVVRGSVDREALAAHWKLPANQRVILAQTVGFPPQ